MLAGAERRARILGAISKSGNTYSRVEHQLVLDHHQQIQTCQIVMGNVDDDETRRTDSASEATRTLEEGGAVEEVPPPLGMFRAVTITLACTLAMVNNVSDASSLAVGAYEN